MLTLQRREDGVWRRTQSALNATRSQWASDSDARRRMVQYRHRFDLHDRRKDPALCLVDTYVWVETCLPREELDEMSTAIVHAASAGGWSACGRSSFGDRRSWMGSGVAGERRFAYRRREAVRAGWSFPSGYLLIDAELRSGPASDYEALRGRSWRVCASGLRRSQQQGTSRVHW